MADLGKAFSYLIAAQVQAIGLILLAYFGGDWLNHHYPVGVNWYIFTFLFAVLGVVQTFYVVVRAAMREGKPSGGADAATKVGKERDKG